MQFLEGPEGVKWEMGLAGFALRKWGSSNIGLGFGHWEWEKIIKNKKKWEWDLRIAN